MKTWLPLTLLCVTLSSAAAAAPPKVAIAFDDQFERRQDIASFQGDVVVVVYGDQDAITVNQVLGEKIRLAYHPSAKGQSPAKSNQAPVTPLPELKPGTRSPDVHVVPVVCYGKTTEVIKSFMRQRLRRQAPETTMLIDFENKMKEEFKLKLGETNLLVIDAAGRLRLKMNGQMVPESYNKVIRAIDFLRKEAAGAP